MIDNAVAALADYAVRTGLIEETDRVWAVNRLLDALDKKTYEAPETVEARPLEAILGTCWTTPWPRGSLRTASPAGTCSTPS